MTCPASRGVWINRIFLMPTGTGSIIDKSGSVPVPLDARPFRIVLQTVQVTATLGGHIDCTAMPLPLLPCEASPSHLGWFLVTSMNLLGRVKLKLRFLLSVALLCLLANPRDGKAKDAWIGLSLTALWCVRSLSFFLLLE